MLKAGRRASPARRLYRRQPGLGLFPPRPLRGFGARARTGYRAETVRPDHQRSPRRCLLGATARGGPVAAPRAPGAPAEPRKCAASLEPPQRPQLRPAARLEADEVRVIGIRETFARDFAAPTTDRSASVRTAPAAPAAASSSPIGSAPFAYAVAWSRARERSGRCLRPRDIGRNSAPPRLAQRSSIRPETLHRRAASPAGTRLAARRATMRRGGRSRGVSRALTTPASWSTCIALPSPRRGAGIGSRRRRPAAGSS